MNATIRSLMAEMASKALLSPSSPYALIHADASQGEDGFCLVVSERCLPDYCAGQTEPAIKASHDAASLSWVGNNNQTIQLGTDKAPMPSVALEAAKSPNGLLTMFINEQTGMPTAWTTIHACDAH